MDSGPTVRPKCQPSHNCSFPSIGIQILATIYSCFKLRQRGREETMTRMNTTHCHLSKLGAMVITEIKLKQDICEESSVPYLSHFLLWADKLRD